MCRSLCVFAIVFVATAAHAQAIVQHREQTVTVRAEGVPIGTLLTELAQRYRLEKVTIQAEVQEHPIWIALDDVPLQDALRRILQASGLDFAISGRRVIVGDWTAAGRGAVEQSAGQRAEAVQAEQEGHPLRVAEEAAIRAAEAAAAEQQAISDAAGDESMIVRANPVRFVANGENITYLEPNFVPYKMRPEVRALRMAIDVATIP